MKTGKCSVCGKEGDLRAGMCVPDYMKQWHEKRAGMTCKFDDCERPVKVRDMCDPHYRKVHRRERLEKELEEKRLIRLDIERIRKDERKKIVFVLSTRLCNDCRGEKSIHPKCFGIKETISVINKLETALS